MAQGVTERLFAADADHRSEL